MGGPKNEAKLLGPSAPEGSHASTQTSLKISPTEPGCQAPTVGGLHRAPEICTAWHQEPDSPLPQAAGPTTSPLSSPGFCWKNQPSARDWDLEGTQPSKVPVSCLQIARQPSRWWCYSCPGKQEGWGQVSSLDSSPHTTKWQCSHWHPKGCFEFSGGGGRGPLQRAWDLKNGSSTLGLPPPGLCLRPVIFLPATLTPDLLQIGGARHQLQ